MYRLQTSRRSQDRHQPEQMCFRCSGAGLRWTPYRQAQYYPSPEKVQAIRDFPQPQFQRQLRQFIGLVNFYHRFLPHCAQLMQPLYALPSKGKSKSQSLTWTDSALMAFNDTKEALAYVLTHPVVS